MKLCCRSLVFRSPLLPPARPPPPPPSLLLPLPPPSSSPSASPSTRGARVWFPFRAARSRSILPLRRSRALRSTFSTGATESKERTRDNEANARRGREIKRMWARKICWLPPLLYRKRVARTVKKHIARGVTSRTSKTCRMPSIARSLSSSWDRITRNRLFQGTIRRWRRGGFGDDEPRRAPPTLTRLLGLSPVHKNSEPRTAETWRLDRVLPSLSHSYSLSLSLNSSLWFTIFIYGSSKFIVSLRDWNFVYIC